MKIGTPRPVAELLAGAVPQLADRLLEYRIRRSWNSLVGLELARRTRPRSLANGCLTVVVDNSPWLSELTLRASELTARLAGELPAVRSLRFTLGAVEPEPRPAPERAERRAVALSVEDRREIDAAAATIPDPALAEAAKRLLTAARRSPSPRGAER